MTEECVELCNMKGGTEEETHWKKIKPIATEYKLKPINIKVIFGCSSSKCTQKIQMQQNIGWIRSGRIFANKFQLLYFLDVMFYAGLWSQQAGGRSYGVSNTFNVFDCTLVSL